MRVKRINKGYTAYLSDHEYSILQRMVERFNLSEEWKEFTSGQKRSWSRRTHGGDFLRVDKDTRK